MASNWTATTDPTAANGATSYSVGDFWLNTVTGKMFQNRVATAGAARWIEVNPVVDVKDYGALGNMRNGSDLAMNANSTSLSSNQLAFTSADVGKTVGVTGAGPSGGVLVSTVQSVNLGVATLATAASTSVTNGAGYVATDDTAAIQAAINSLPVSQGQTNPSISVGGAVFFPNGQYLITSSLAITGNVALIGSGDATALYANTQLSTTRGAIEIGMIAGQQAFAEHITVERMSIYTTSGYGITTNSSTELTIVDSVFRDLAMSCQNTAIYLPGTLSGNIGAYCVNCDFDNIRFYNNGAGLIRVLGNLVRITRCDSEQAPRSGYDHTIYAIHCENAGAWGNSYVIRENLIQHGPNVRAVLLAGGLDHTFTGNWVEGVVPTAGDFAYTFQSCSGLKIDRLLLDPTNNIKASFTACDAKIEFIDLSNNQIAPGDVLSWDTGPTGSTIRIGRWSSMFDPAHMDDENLIIESYSKLYNSGGSSPFSVTGIDMPRTGNLCPNGNFAAGMYTWNTQVLGTGVVGSWSVQPNSKGGKLAQLSISSNPNNVNLVGSLQGTFMVPANYVGLPGFISFETTAPSNWSVLFDDPAGNTFYNRVLGSKTIIRYNSLPSSMQLTWLVYTNSTSPATGNATVGDIQLVAGTRANYVPDIAASRQWPNGTLHITGSQAPSTGSWPTGSIVWNDLSLTQTYAGWIYNGTTWKGFGALAP